MCIRDRLKGWQMLKEENAELIIDGKRVENDYTFIADDEEMKVEIAYTFNASELGSKNLVTFEELYDLSNPDEPVKVAEHKEMCIRDRCSSMLFPMTPVPIQAIFI